jgi:ParB family transcriptional regulator, chromosome partitioning protein
LGRIVVELTIVLSAARTNAPQVLRDGASVYKVDIEAITTKVRQEFAAKAKKGPQPTTKAAKKAA